MLTVLSEQSGPPPHMPLDWGPSTWKFMLIDRERVVRAGYPFFMRRSRRTDRFV
jgi:hypothetical protein